MLSISQIKKLSKDIVECFPTETECIYYTPYKKINNNIRLTRGKLWDRYCNVRKGIRTLNSGSNIKESVSSEIIEPNEG